ncbi:MAG TPA: RNA methyltransferase [Syntrophomonadaceae bacterium]|nr:RNA methyltransferase [Syntrophomonadaceae bacterium]
MPVKHISSVDNRNIKLAVKLADKKIRDREGLFFAEGRKSVMEVLKRPELISAIFIEDINQNQYQKLIAEYNYLEWYSVNSQLMKRICHTETPQGIAVMVKKPKWPLDKIIAGDSLLLYLDRISDPGNIGTIIRTAWAFDVNGRLLSPGCVDPFSPKVVRSTMGGIFNVPLITDINEEQLVMLQDKGYNFAGADLSGNSSFYDMDFSNRIVVVIGNEVNGINDYVKGKCNFLFKIPINSAADSLNAAVACAIIIEKAYRQRHFC